MTEKTDQVLFEVIYMIHLIFNRIRFFQEFCASSLLVQKLFYQCEYEDIKQLLSLPSAKYAYITSVSEGIVQLQFVSNYLLSIRRNTWIMLSTQDMRFVLYSVCYNWTRIIILLYLYACVNMNVCVL